MAEQSIGIGQFALQARLSVSAVRFYCDRGLLSPGFVDQSNRYRRFFPSQIADAELIRDLRTMGLSLDQVSEAAGMDPSERADFIRAHVEQLEEAAVNAAEVAAGIGYGQSSRPAKPVEPTVVLAETLLEAIGQIVPTAGTDMTAPHLMCVLVEIKDHSLRFVATDSYRLSIRDCVPTNAGSDFAIVLAAARLTEWACVLEGSTSQEVKLIANEHGGLTATGRGISISAPRLPIEFPPYEQVLNRQSVPTTQLTCDRAELLEALSKFRGPEPLRLCVGNQQIRLSRGPSSDEVTARTIGKFLETWVNPEFAASAAKHAVGAEIVIEATSPDQPLLFRSADSGTYTSLLMPVLQ